MYYVDHEHAHKSRTRAHAHMLCAHLHTTQPTKDQTISAAKIVQPQYCTRLSNCIVNKQGGWEIAQKKINQRLRKRTCRANISQHHHKSMASLFPRRPCDALPFDGIIKFSADSFDLLLFPVCSSSRGFSVTSCRCRRNCMHALRCRRRGGGSSKLGQCDCVMRGLLKYRDKGVHLWESREKLLRCARHSGT